MRIPPRRISIAATPASASGDRSRTAEQGSGTLLCMGFNVPPYPNRTQELLAGLVDELRRLRAAVADDVDLQAAERAALECATRVSAYAARLLPTDAKATAATEPPPPEDAVEPLPDGINVPPHPH